MKDDEKAVFETLSKSLKTISKAFISIGNNVRIFKNFGPEGTDKAKSSKRKHQAATAKKAAKKTTVEKPTKNATVKKPATKSAQKALYKASGAVVQNSTKQLDALGPGSAVRTVIDDQHRFSFFTGQSIKHSKQPLRQAKKQSPPVKARPSKQLVGCIFTEADIFVDNDTTEEILADKGQCKYGFCQRANAVTVAFTNTASVHQRAAMEPVEKIVNFTLQFNVGLRLGGDFAMVHLSLFSLILL